MVEWLAGNRIRGTNAERTTTTGFNPVTTQASGWKLLGRKTLESTGDTITVSDLADKRYYMVLGDKQSSGSADFNWRVGNGSADPNNNYARRQSSNGGTTTVNAGYDRMFADNGGSTTPSFQVAYFANKSDKQKLNITHSVSQGTAGLNAPPRRESVNKWTDTSNPIDVIQGVNVEGGDFASGSEVVVLGWDPADIHTDNFWEELDDASWSSGGTISSNTFTAKKYLWVQGWYTTDSTNGNVRMTFNGDSTSSYAMSYNTAGAGDEYVPSSTYLYVQVGGNPNNTVFFNYFIINNASSEKLIIGRNNLNNTSGAGNSPIRNESGYKWTRTSGSGTGTASAQITSLSIARSSGSYGSGQIKVWGSD